MLKCKSNGIIVCRHLVVQETVAIQLETIDMCYSFFFFFVRYLNEQIFLSVQERVPQSFTVFQIVFMHFEAYFQHVFVQLHQIHCKLQKHTNYRIKFYLIIILLSINKTIFKRNCQIFTTNFIIYQLFINYISKLTIIQFYKEM